MLFFRFGKSGASLSFSRVIANTSFNDVLVYTDTGEERKYARDASTELYLLNRKNLFKAIVSVFAIIKKLIHSSDPAVILMPSPFDWLLVLKKGGVQNVYVIVHDDKTHKGDKKFKEWIAQSFWRICKPKIITLSIYVKKSLEAQGFSVTGVATHPHLIPQSIMDSILENKFTKVYDFGIFGRLKSYQGRDYYDIVRKGIYSCEKSLVICGGDKKEDFGLYENEVRYAGGVSDELFFELMAKTRTIVLPYTEATQSGVIPNAIFLGCKIMTTKVGGIPEQDINSDFTYFSLTEESILAAIKACSEGSMANSCENIVGSEIIEPSFFYKSLKRIYHESS